MRYTAGTAHKVSGLSYRQLDHWASSGFLRPTAKDTTGQGNHREYSFSDLVALRAAARLRKEGVSLQSLRQIVNYLQRRHEYTSSSQVLARTYLVYDGTDVLELRGRELVSCLKKPGQFAFRILHLGELVAEVQRGLKEVA